MTEDAGQIGGIHISEGNVVRTIATNPALPPNMARSGAWRVEDFDLHKELYRGKTSLVYMATDRRSGTHIALKLYRKRKLSTMNRYQVEREIRLHIKLDHVNIIKLYAAFEDEKNVYMAQEFATGGDLFEDLKKSGGQIKEKYVVRDIIVPFLNVLQYLHSMGIIHRDIKPENILLSSDHVIKIADFGLSICIHEERPVTRAGTLDYMAPEVLVCPDKRRPEENKDKAVLAYSTQVDVWAVGVLAYELLVGYPPFEQESRTATYEHIMYKDPYFSSAIPSDAKSFIQTALAKNASKRPTISQLAAMPWVQPFVRSAEEAERSDNSASTQYRSQGSPSLTASPHTKRDSGLRDVTSNMSVEVDEDSSYAVTDFESDLAASLSALSPTIQPRSNNQKRMSSNLRPRALPVVGEGQEAAYYRPQGGVLSDDAQVPTARPKSISSNLQPGARTQALRPPNNSLNPQRTSGSFSRGPGAGGSHLDRLAELSGGHEDDAVGKTKSGSKYNSLFSKMWGGVGGKPMPRGNSPASGAMLKSSFTGKKGDLQSLQEEVMASRESSVMVGRDGSVLGAPTMTFKQTNPSALQAMRNQHEASSRAHDARLAQARPHPQDEFSVNRINSEATMIRPNFDSAVGRSFTASNKPALRKFANAPLVNKIEEYVQSHGAS